MSRVFRNLLGLTPLLAVISSLNSTALAITPTAEGLKTDTNVTQKLEVEKSDQSVSNVANLTNINNQDTNATVEQEQEQEQVTSVSQLSDVQPNDWAFQALQSLVERYGCIAGYPNGTFRGNRAITRYEFAAGLNACLDRVQELIAISGENGITKEDLDTLQKLQQEFADGLVEIRGRIDNLESRTAVLESQQFSTTTKLNAEVILAVGGVFGGDRALNSDQWRTINNAPTDAAREAARNAAFGTAGRRLLDNTTFSDRVRLNLISSFTGKDQLLARLEANNSIAFNNPVTGTNMTRTSWDTTNNADNSVQLGKLFYRFPVGDQLNIIIDAIGGEFYDNFNTVNPLLSSTPQGSISRFGRFSPIYRASNTGSGSNIGSGISAVYKLSDAVTLSGGYLARRANDPTQGRSLFDGTYAALGQLTFQPNSNFTLGLTYAHAYYAGVNDGDVTVSGAYGSAFSNNPFNSTTTTPVNTSANHYGIETSYRFSPQFVLSGWVGYTQAIAENSAGTNVNRGDSADIWNWAVTLALPDLGKRGNLGGIIFGQPPKVTGSDFGPANLTATSNRRIDSDTSYHLEALYRYQLNSNISVTPGLIVIFNPEHNSNNDTIYTGVIRTTFRF
jgi:hypothetical protein